MNNDDLQDKPRRGRPPSGQALSDAERARRYRARRKQLKAETPSGTQPMVISRDDESVTKLNRAVKREASLVMENIRLRNELAEAKALIEQLQARLGKAR